MIFPFSTNPPGKGVAVKVIGVVPVAVIAWVNAEPSLVTSERVLVICGATGFWIVRVSVFVPVPTGLVADRPTENVPAADGVPVIKPRSSNVFPAATVAGRSLVSRTVPVAVSKLLMMRTLPVAGPLVNTISFPGRMLAMLPRLPVEKMPAENPWVTVPGNVPVPFTSDRPAGNPAAP